jgi:hypothetical protein
VGDPARTAASYRTDDPRPREGPRPGAGSALGRLGPTMVLVQDLDTMVLVQDLDSRSGALETVLNWTLPLSLRPFLSHSLSPHLLILPPASTGRCHRPLPFPLYPVPQLLILPPASTGPAAPFLLLLS